jgi:hypothetical protein
MAEVTPDPIMEIAMGFMAAKHLFVATEIGLFTGLAQGPATLDELAATCGIPRRTAGIRGLVVITQSARNFSGIKESLVFFAAAGYLSSQISSKR